MDEAIGTSDFPKNLPNMVYQSLQEYLGTQHVIHSNKYLTQLLDDWTNKHYVALSDFLLMSVFSVKRLFNYPGHFPSENLNKASKEKLTKFLGYEYWEILEDELIKRASRKL